MKFIKLEDRIVTEINESAAAGLVEAHDGVALDDVHDGSDYYEVVNFSKPVSTDSTWEQVSGLQASKINEVRWIAERHVTQREIEGFTDFAHTPEEYQSVLAYMQSIREQDETNHTTPQSAIDALVALVKPV